MRLKNKKTGEIVDFRYLQSDHVAPLVLTTYKNDKPEMYSYNSLTELNADWEDAPEEPKKYWFLSGRGEVKCIEDENTVFDKDHKSIGNYFESREEAEKAVEKLKAWKQLKDVGCRVTEYKAYGGTTSKGEFIGEVKIILDVPDVVDKELLRLLFGGDE